MSSIDEQKVGLTPKQTTNEVIVLLDSAGVLTAGENRISVDSGSNPGLNELLSEHGASLKLLFGTSQERLNTQILRAKSTFPDSGGSVPDLTQFFRVETQSSIDDELLNKIRGVKGVKSAYIKPGAVRAIFTQPSKRSVQSAASATPNYQPRQGYLSPSPGGVDVQYAHWMVGGQGERISICSIEWGWLFTHEDLTENQGGVMVGNSPYADDHGTATGGVVSGDKNEYGILGMCPKAQFYGASLNALSVSQAIKSAADKLNAGDVIYMSIHRWGPNSNGSGQYGYIPVEWWPDDFAAIQYATAKGIVVVEAAGNGSQNLDDPVYETARATYGFPNEYRNPFNPQNPSSGAVMVGAGAPPPGSHGHSWWGPDRSRLWYSNYGKRVDAQAWGYDVTTTGYGDLQGGNYPELYYTDSFSGTSSATPIVAGCIASTQGVLRDFGRRAVTGEQYRQLLRTTGSPQQDGDNGPKSQRIGNRPNLRELIPAAIKLTEWRAQKL